MRPFAPVCGARGMALIAVLWIVAALSVMVIGLTSTVKDQTRIASAMRDQTSGQAVGEAAFALALQAMQAAPARNAQIVSAPFEVGGLAVDVEVAPLNGLVSLNGANAELLAAVLQTAGGLNAGAARALATQIVQWRDERPQVDPTSPMASAVQARRFEAVEDLMLVPGIDYSLYARIAPLFSADLVGGGAQVNVAAAPPEVLAVLAGGDVARAAAYAAARAAQPAADASAFQGPFAGAGGTDVYRLRANVPLDAGRMLELTRDVAFGTQYSPELPWRTLRQSRRIVSAAGP